MRRILILTMLGFSSVAMAAPGIGDPVYPATMIRGFEFEARYGRLTGGSADREDGLVLEAERTFSTKFAAALLVETAREPGGRRGTDAVALEAITHIAHVSPLKLDIALYGELKHGLRGNSDAFEGKLLVQHLAGPFDGRVNLIGAKPFVNGPVELSYAASVDWQIAGEEVKLGLAAFGDLGTTRNFGGRQEQYIGPEAKFEIEHIGRGDIEIETGWLRAFGAARDRSDGQARLLVSYELHF